MRFKNSRLTHLLYLCGDSDWYLEGLVTQTRHPADRVQQHWSVDELSRVTRCLQSFNERSGRRQAAEETPADRHVVLDGRRIKRRPAGTQQPVTLRPGRQQRYDGVVEPIVVELLWVTQQEAHRQAVHFRSILDKFINSQCFSHTPHGLPSSHAAAVLN